VLSDLGLLAVGYGLYNLAQAFGWTWLVKTYFIPYLFVNFW
jgi:omega-6 fatty acid desaturase (delta-12 desaturase)